MNDDEEMTAEQRFDMRQQPGHLISTSDLDAALQYVNVDHGLCSWNAAKEDGCSPETWHQNVCADDAETIGGHGYLEDLFLPPAELQAAHEEYDDAPEPSVMYGFLTTTAALYLLRETRALRDEQAARHEEAMEVQRQILEELRRR
jgi:hypothetical protein